METRPSKTYKYFERLLAVVTLGGNTVGALLTVIYLNYIDPVPVSGGQAFRPVEGSGLFFSLAGIVTLLIVGSLSSAWVDKGIKEAYTRLVAGMPAIEVDEAVRRRVLNYPFAISLTSAMMWFLAAFFLGFLTTGSLQTFSQVLGVGGVLTVTILYFGVDLIWREVVLVFFPEGRLSAVRAVRLPVFRRLLIFYVLIGLYPAVMLSAVTFSRARGILTAADPQVVLQNMVWAMVFVVLVCLFLGISLTILITRSIVHPLMGLRNAMAQVEHGDFKAGVEVVTNDELGYVSERFNDMVKGLRQAEMMRNLLNLYVSPEVARNALEHGTQLGGQLVECSILFSDIRGFTSLSEKLSPEALIDLLNRYMSRMVEVVIANGGIVNKFGGDSLLALFGTPLVPAQDHAARAIRAALQMQTALKSFNQEQAQRGGPALQIGIGIASGPAVAGNVGGEGRIEYTVIGDTVNLASRLQDLTKELGREVLASAQAVEQATRHLSLAAEPLPPVSVRGKAEQVKIYAIITDIGEKA